MNLSIRTIAHALDISMRAARVGAFKQAATMLRDHVADTRLHGACDAGCVMLLADQLTERADMEARGRR